jgi:hypothetical protein
MAQRVHREAGMATFPERDQRGPSTLPELAEARANVVDALGKMERGERNSLDILRSVLCTYVTTLKAEGASREQAIEAVRKVISEPTTPDGAFRLLAPAREALIELSVHWCGEEYGRG